jgi:hypothetical protein
MAPGFGDVEPFVYDRGRARDTPDQNCRRIGPETETMTSTVLFMPLLNEGTEVWRPVAVEPLSNGTYKILGPIPEDEEWAFPPGSIVGSLLRTFNAGDELLVAVPLS